MAAGAMTAKKQPAQSGEVSAESTPTRKKTERKKRKDKDKNPFAAPEDGQCLKLVQDALCRSSADMRGAAALFTVAARKGYLPAYMLLAEKAKENGDEDLVIDTLFRMLGASDVQEQFPEDMLRAYAIQLSVACSKSEHTEKLASRAEELAILANIWPQELQFLKLVAENAKLRQSSQTSKDAKDAHDALIAIQQQTKQEQTEERESKVQMSLEVQETFRTIQQLLNTSEIAATAQRRAEDGLHTWGALVKVPTPSSTDDAGATSSNAVEMDESTSDIFTKVRRAMKAGAGANGCSAATMDATTADIVSKMRGAMDLKTDSNPTDPGPGPIKMNEATAGIFGQVQAAIKKCEGTANQCSTAPASMDENTAEIVSKLQNAFAGGGTPAAGKQTPAVPMKMDEGHTGVVGAIKQAIETVAQAPGPVMNDTTAEVFSHLQKACTKPGSAEPDGTTGTVTDGVRKVSLDDGTADVFDKVQKALKFEQASLSKQAKLKREQDEQSKLGFSLLHASTTAASNDKPEAMAPVPAAPPAAHHPFAWRRGDHGWDFCAEVPQLDSLAEGSLELSGNGILLKLPKGEVFINELPPKDVQLDPEGATAKWARKSHTLTVNFPWRAAAAGQGDAFADEQDVHRLD